MQQEYPLPDWLLSSLSHIPAWQLWKTLTRVYTACPFGSHSGQSAGHSLSFAICFDSLSPPPLCSDNTELNVMMQGHNTHTCRFKHTQTSSKARKWRGARKRLREMHTRSEQSVAGCKQACAWTRGECKTGFTPNPESAGYWIISYRESWTGMLAAKSDAPLRSKMCLSSVKKIPTLKTAIHRNQA